MKEIAIKTLGQIVPIILSAAVAAGLAFFTNLAQSWGSCGPVSIPTGEVTALGAVIKAIHQAKTWA